MTAPAVVLVLLAVAAALLLGAALGWQAAARRVETRRAGELTAAVAEAAALRQQLAHEQQAAARRESLLLQSDQQARHVLGEQAAGLLEQVHTELRRLEAARAGSDATLREQARAISEAGQRLQHETRQLVTALRAPHSRGRWGEMQLQRVVEAAGMTEHVDYDTQVPSPGGADEPGLRPDLLVRLTGGKVVVVDAKVPLAGWLAATEAEDDATRTRHLVAHARHLRTHVDQLSAKAYWQRFTPTPEFVVCFVPSDAVLDAALRQDPSLLEHAFAGDVVLATPSTLVALLRTIAHTWRQDALTRDVAAVHELGRQLHARLATMGGHLDKLGRSLGAAVAAYNETVGSLERRVLSSARRLGELGVTGPADRPLTGPTPLLEATPRPLTAPEFVGLERDDSPAA